MIWLVDENANFIVNDTSICRNSIAVFSATAAAANIESYSWTFGDGTSASGQFVQHKYTQAGSFDVSLIIKDVRDCKDTLIKRNYIKVTGPTADFTVSDTTPCLHDAVNFMDNSLTDAVNPITSWTWNYGDGITETLNSGPFQHTYTIPGIRTITLMTTDSGGCSDTIVKARLITISNPLANFNTNDTLSCPNTAIHFNNNSTGLNLTYRWDFGDGTTGNLISPVHSYASDGIYTVTLFITDRYGCTHTASRLNFIKIVTPVADFAMSDSFGTCPPLVVNFTNNSLNAVSLNWDFGDGSYSQTNHPTHFYNTPGTFIAKLTITGPGGCMSVRSRQIIVKGPQGSFSYDTLSGCKPLLVNFVAISRDRSSFVWDFNDGSTINTADSVVSHAYTIPGDYVPKMILLDAGGCFVPVTGNDTIKVKGVTASFNPDLQTICNSGNVQFTNTSSGNDPITNYQWNFGDGGSSGMENPVHTYQANGIYYPTVKVTSLSGCLDSVRSTVPVKVVASPQGLISQTANGCSPLTVMFNASLAIADTSLMAWQWNFGNGNTSILPTPVTQLYAAGSYPVTLLVTNSSGCRDTVQTTVRSYAIPVVSAGSDNTICQGTGKTLTPSGAAVYSWSPPTGLSCTDCPNPLATPASATTYIVTGTSTEGCKNIDSVYVTVKYPFMISSSRPDTLCNGRSLRLAAAGAHSYEWSPSTGLSSTSISNPVASPNNTVTYRVIGKDELNCFRDTAYVPVTVFPVPAVDAGDDKTINVGQTIDLVPKISADVTEVSWSPTGSIFRNDYPAITVKPRETTTYTVKVSNKGGCTSTDDLTVTVICNGANVFIPNTFSPNGDGMNDIFYPRGSGVFSIKAARIFSRWGELIYEKNNFMANDVSSGWDGTFKGQKLSPDVYVYVIEVLCDNNTMMPLKGNIALLK
jgi:gliding motility-associated-like protein